MWVVERVTKNRQRAEQAPLLPIGPLPHIQCHSTATSVTPPWWTPKAPPPYIIGAPRKKEMAQMKAQIRAPEKIQLSKKEIANLSVSQFKTLVIRMLTEKIEYGHKIEETVKAMKSEIKENVQGANSDRKETRTQIKGQDQKEEINIQWNRMKKQEFKKMRGVLGTSGTTLNVQTTKS